MDLSSVILRPMTVDDIAGGLRLSIEEGWNQTEDDWQFLIKTKENICIVAEHRKKIIGTTTIANYRNDVAWIGMVLVDKECRGKGVSKLLLENILKRLDKFKSIKLDATPSGLKVYEKFGFKKEYTITRMVAGSLHSFTNENDSVENVSEGEIQQIIDLDKKVFGIDRSELIDTLAKMFPKKVFALKQNGMIKGFALGRKGSKYHHIGPVIAKNFNNAKKLVSKALQELNKMPVVADVLNDKIEVISFLEKSGFKKQREFTRMYKNENVFVGNPKQYYLICGPEFG